MCNMHTTVIELDSVILRGAIEWVLSISTGALCPVKYFTSHPVSFQHIMLWGTPDHVLFRYAISTFSIPAICKLSMEKEIIAVRWYCNIIKWSKFCSIDLWPDSSNLTYLWPHHIIFLHIHHYRSKESPFYPGFSSSYHWCMG